MRAVGRLWAIVRRVGRLWLVLVVGVGLVFLCGLWLGTAGAAGHEMRLRSSAAATATAARYPRGTPGPNGAVGGR